MSNTYNCEMCDCILDDNEESVEIHYFNGCRSVPGWLCLACVEKE